MAGGRGAVDVGGRWGSVLALIAEQVARTPDGVAVCDGKEEVSYREVEERSSRRSRHLKKRGLGAESRVGVCLERSAGMVVSVVCDESVTTKDSAGNAKVGEMVRREGVEPST